MVLKGSRLTEEHKRKIIEANRGQKRSEETKRRMSEAQKKVLRSAPHTPEHKRKISESCKGKPPTYGMLGKHHTEETKRKISEAQKGRIVPPEKRKRISETLKGKMGGENHPFYGKKLSDTHIKHLSESHKGKMTGESHPHWKGGISFEPYCPKFNNDFKERVREFFDRKCVECGEPENGEKLNVHHVNFNKMTCCDGTAPLFVSLCRSCHARTQANREYWEQHFTDMIMQYYEGRCYILKEEMI